MCQGRSKTILIAAAFCMYNRYVDGLQTVQPRKEAMYREMGQHMAEEGYCRSSETVSPGV
jgi:hypothetical protein